MFLQYFGLDDDPFGVTPEPRYLYESNTHREALASLKYGFYSNRGFTALIAPPGLGKTTLLQRFLGDIRESARSVFLFDIDGQCEPRELIGSILRDLGITPAKTSSEMHEQLNVLLVEEARRGRAVAVVIDEAQNLSEAALESVRLLSNFETTRAKLIHIVLAGQPQLSDKLMQPSLVQLRQRITTICHLDPLSAEETRAYIGHRLKLAGHNGESLFTNDALSLIAEASKGIPRTINNLSFNAISLCRALNRKQVVGSMVEEAISDMQLVPHVRETSAAPELLHSGVPTILFEPTRAAGFRRRWTIAAAAVLGVSLLGSLGFSGSRVLLSRGIQFIDSKSMPASVSVPGAKKSDIANIISPASADRPFQVTAALHQTNDDAAVPRLRELDESWVRQVHALNPTAINTNHSEARQRIWLAGEPAPHLAESAVKSTDARSLP